MAGKLEILLMRTADRDGVGVPAVPLGADGEWALVPLTDEIVAAILGDADETEAVDGFYDLTAGIAEWARQRSVHGDVAYAHVEFFAGTGFHAAVAWRAGAVAWGPVFTANATGEAEDHYEIVGRDDMAVNALLRWLGVDRGDAFDEFAAVGLDRHRWTDGWAADVTR
ncbi:hypothetical protein [Actinoplanes utahensis]|uniref:hypothetical protein n=1 Tax=Actinoplanes utahensis TaxID=1869 RepID=UPI00068C68A9|nr:hypothetical protein [Actinoplanes utahensis]GIF30668.1 hypothetical protein Aut01nite_36540 [Actinoplanes utahensis]